MAVIVVAFLGLGVSVYWKMILQQETLLQGLCLHLGEGPLPARPIESRFQGVLIHRSNKPGRPFVIAYRSATSRKV